MLSRAYTEILESFIITHLPKSCYLQLPKAGGSTGSLVVVLNPGLGHDLASYLSFQRWCWDPGKASFVTQCSRELQDAAQLMGADAPIDHRKVIGK